MPSAFIEKLQAAQRRNNTWLCVGLDPVPGMLPPGVDLTTFSTAIIDATASVACAFKPNLMFYLAYGAEGIRALETTIAHAPDEVPVILDAKFGDIGYTAERYAHAAFETFGADAVTLSPYVGMDAVRPLLRYTDRAVFMLVRSTNTTGNDFQLWPNAHQPLYRHITAQINTLAAEHPGQLGLMVGATQPRDLARIRDWAPTLPFLIPGVGVQAGDLGVAVERGITRSGIGPIISVTRAVIYASQGADFAEAARTAAETWSGQIHIRQGND